MDTRISPERGSGYSAMRSSASRVPVQARCVTLAINGLYYEHCEIGLAYQLHGSTGVVDVVVDPRAGTATITFDECRLSEKRVEQLVSECGYELGRRDRPDMEGG